VRARSRESAEAFVLDMLRRHGGVLVAQRKNVARVRFPAPPPFSPTTDLIVAFERKGLSHTPDAVPAMPGSPLYLKLLELARSGGATATAYGPVVEPLPEAPSPRHFADPGQIRWEAGEMANQPHVLFNFAVAYHSVVTSDDLVCVGYDVVRGAFRDPALVDAIHSVWCDFVTQSPVGCESVPAPEPRDVLPAALHELDIRTRRKVGRARRNTQRYLDHEIQNVEEYYRQLISEEKELLNRLSNTSPTDAREHERRIRRYQLDWKRRIAEEVRHHQCRVNIRLVSAAVIYMPRTPLLVTIDGTAGTERCYFNHFLGTIDGIICAQTGSEFGPWRRDGDGRWRSVTSEAERLRDTENGNDDEPPARPGVDVVEKR
jgi:hypothetical protein